LCVRQGPAGERPRPRDLVRGPRPHPGGAGRGGGAEPLQAGLALECRRPRHRDHLGGGSRMGGAVISRYSDPEVDLAFADYTKYSHWLDLELAVWSARHQLGQAPAVPLLRFGVEALAEVRDLERATGHDVGAFVR